jgi:hypothetical protein
MAVEDQSPAQQPMPYPFRMRVSPGQAAGAHDGGGGQAACRAGSQPFDRTTSSPASDTTPTAM